MKLRALDQVHVSSVQADSLRPGQEFEVSDTLGTQMLKSLPGRVERVDAEEFGGKGDHDHNGTTGGAAAPVFDAPVGKAEPAPQNKAEPAAPANKAAASKGKAKAKKA